MLDQTRLPKPEFSSNNPYWQDPRKYWGWLRADLRPRNTAQDFLYATTWEMYKWDTHGAYCIRSTMQQLAIAQLHIMSINLKELAQYEKAV